MCQLYQSIGLWTIVAVTSVLSMVLGGAAGWRAHTVRYWRMQTKRDIASARKVGRWAANAAMGITVVGFFAYTYLTRG